MTSGFYLGGGLLLALILWTVWLFRQGKKAQRADTLEAERDVRNEGNKARHDLRIDDEALDRLRKQ